MPSAATALSTLFARRNRGLLLDIFVFLVNVFLMRMLVGEFLAVAHAASNGDFLSQFTLFLGAVCVMVLPPIGATLKRWHHYSRLNEESRKAEEASTGMGGCLFNPIFYFSLTVLIFSAVNAGLMQFVYGNREPSGAVFVSSIFIGFALMITHTVLVYRYFSPPKHEPRSAFLRDPSSELIGDICIFVNMILFQVIWNLLTVVPFERVSSVLDFGGRLFLLSFSALLLYFPPRMFYLADDIRKWRTWAMILLANSPVIVKVMLGNGNVSGW